MRSDSCTCRDEECLQIRQQENRLGRHCKAFVSPLQKKAVYLASEAGHGPSCAKLEQDPANPKHCSARSSIHGVLHKIHNELDLLLVL